MAVDGSWWQLMAVDGSWWQLMAVDCWWQLMADGSWWQLMAVDGSWWLMAVDGWWQLMAVDGSWCVKLGIGRWSDVYLRLSTEGAVVRMCLEWETWIWTMCLCVANVGWLLHVFSCYFQEKVSKIWGLILNGQLTSPISSYLHFWSFLLWNATKDRKICTGPFTRTKWHLAKEKARLVAHVVGLKGRMRDVESHSLQKGGSRWAFRCRCLQALHFSLGWPLLTSWFSKWQEEISLLLRIVRRIQMFLTP